MMIAKGSRVWIKGITGSNLWVLLLLISVAGCVMPTQTVSETPLPSETPTLPPPGVNITQVPDIKPAAQAYLEAWKADSYPVMYTMLTSLSQDAIEEEEFTDWHLGVVTEAAVNSVDYEILSTFVRSPRSAQVKYRVMLHSVLVGDIQRDTVMNLSMEAGEWRVQWADDLILPELGGGNYLWMDRHIPSRANIYDREGSTIAAFAEAVSIGLAPGQIEEDGEEAVLSELQWLTDIHPDAIAAMYEDFPPGSDWYLPLGEAPMEKVQQRYDVVNGYSDNGLLMYPFQSRFYFNNGIAPQAVGYVSFIQEHEAERYLRRGYQIDEKVGRQGIEQWGEPYLGGKRGGTLYVVNPEGEIVTQLADVPAQPSQSVYTTLDKDLQLGAQQALQGFRGAIVVLEMDTGRVLVMASAPDFDPNAFEPSNQNSAALLQELYAEESNQPLLNRATFGQYPLGSVFKIVTISAALESGRFTPETTYECGYQFTELEGVTLYDWTYDHFQEDGKTQPSGTLTLPEGLMRSCNPFFWHIGLDLYREGLTEAISEMAEGFGLGSPTGIEGVDEEEGQIPIPQSEVDATNLAIGQGSTLVTPLQVARFVSSVGNGGTLYRPQIIERIAPPDGEATFIFEPDASGSLPVTTDTLKIVQDALVSVVSNPRGTAYYVLGPYSHSSSIPLAGKTGTAESGSGAPHAWFAGYTSAGREDKPDIAIAVVVENAGEGSEYAAPIFKGLIQLYFTGNRFAFPWESTVGVLATPEPEGTETPEP